MLKLNNIGHRYGDQRVLSRVSVAVAPGERLAIMGPSGCGKTTLLRIALGLTKPSQGAVENTFRKTAAVFQEPRLLPWRTALENVNLVLGDTAQTLPRALMHLNALGLEDAAGKSPAQLSGGMQQRVALARALAVDADLLVLDEPFKAMDEKLRWEVISRVAQTNAAILLVTHDEAEATALGCKILPLV